MLVPKGTESRELELQYLNSTSAKAVVWGNLYPS